MLLPCGLPLPHLQQDEGEERWRVALQVRSPFGDKIKDMMKSIEDFSGLCPTNDHGSQSYEQWVVQKEKTAAKEGNRKQHVCALHLKKYNDALQIYDTIRMNDALTHLTKFYDEETKRAIFAE
ncbi:unnamed protein product [Ranitomeya imitator]|uniref:RIG-I-like receptor C-terminal domain-containing protein n=1 Tax=Ranitomeya imitator TaxID=111125 RepID=A0ABN9KW24_9NEOB|nr:unnamed protein product [Ranitomeya imitator]